MVYVRGCGELKKNCNTCEKTSKCDIYARYVTNAKEPRSFIECDRFVPCKGEKKNAKN